MAFLPVCTDVVLVPHVSCCSFSIVDRDFVWPNTLSQQVELRLKIEHAYICTFSFRFCSATDFPLPFSWAVNPATGRVMSHSLNCYWNGSPCRFHVSFFIAYLYHMLTIGWYVVYSPRLIRFQRRSCFIRAQLAERENVIFEGELKCLVKSRRRHDYHSEVRV